MEASLCHGWAQKDSFQHFIAVNAQKINKN